MCPENVSNDTAGRMDDQTKVFCWLCSPKVADLLEGENTGLPFRTFSVKNFVSIKRTS